MLNRSDIQIGSILWFHPDKTLLVVDNINEIPGSLSFTCHHFDYPEREKSSYDIMRRTLKEMDLVCPAPCAAVFREVLETYSRRLSGTTVSSL